MEYSRQAIVVQVSKTLGRPHCNLVPCLPVQVPIILQKLLKVAIGDVIVQKKFHALRHYIPVPDMPEYLNLGRKRVYEGLLLLFNRNYLTIRHFRPINNARASFPNFVFIPQTA
ncbi:methyl-accepting chemotaxis sensory transducer [Striga asiatica]|uniref:Methyl-accepting chemotaxis sensory transducer n=1 Tax=Striga asiatica TaxID=4170 RepID=A0A5A7RCK8_STRAF|nr:methyl-accepting chemotaxis sensory transducer [Striga asiatica]